ncbi:MAG: hypothetical protein WD696_13230 [Bryobacteraceae bacterium]
MTIKVPIPDDLVPVLERKARSAGLEREEYVGAILSRELNAPQTLNEVLAAFREQVAASGIADRDLDELFRAARDEADAQGNV